MESNPTADPVDTTDPTASWKTKGLCYDLPFSGSAKDKFILDSFFSDSVSDRQVAIKFCGDCPVQQRCLQYALEGQELWGVWGGRDESEIRRDLWTNSNGSIGGRARVPRCAWCRSRNGTLEVTDTSSHTVKCSECDFTWQSETTCMGLENRDKSVNEQE